MMVKKNDKRFVRSHAIPIRFTDEEYALINRLAEKEYDYVSGFLRRMVLVRCAEIEKENEQVEDNTMEIE